MSSKDKQEKLKKYDDYINHLHRLRMEVGSLETMVESRGVYYKHASSAIRFGLHKANDEIANELKDVLYSKHNLERYE